MSARTRVFVPALLVTALLAVTGCGSDGGDDNGGGQAAGPTAESATPEPTDPTEPTAAEETTAEVPQALRFTGTTVDGADFDGATLAGKPTVLWFWAPWCPVCRGQAEATAEVAADFAGEVNVVGVAGLDSNAAMAGFVSDTGTEGFPHLSDEAGEIWQRFEITEQSTYVLLDTAGETVYQGVLPGGEGLADRVAELAG